MVMALPRYLPPSFEAIHLVDFLVREEVFHAYRAGLRLLPPLTTVLVAACVTLHVLTGLDQGALLAAREPATLLVWGARDHGLVAQGELWRLMSCVFLHGDLLHIALNMLTLYGLGRLLEAVYGPARVLFIFSLSGLSGSLAGHFFGGSLSVGASGAIFGLLGAGVAFGLLHGRELPSHMRRVLGRGLLPWVLLNLVIGVAIPGIDNAAHVGGLLGGAVVATFLGDRLVPWSQQYRWAGPVMVVVGSVLLTVPLVVVIAR